ncbi:hypothetical protein EIP86_011033 [Pleurotus ostreatoroseus]|nr:hypothetical protein EIP86_011033 [Pleurotus ostreatoroseus]
MTDIVLTLTPNNPNNTEITLSDSPGVVYKVTTERNGVAATTRVYDKDSREVASLDWRASSPDGVTFGEQDLSAVSVTQWMKKSLVPFKRKNMLDASDTDTDISRSPTAKGESTAGKAWIPQSVKKLFAEDDGFKTPICRYEDDRLTNGFGRPQNLSEAQVVLTPRAQEIQNLAIVSFLFLERHKRKEAGRYGVNRSYVAEVMAVTAASDGQIIG